MQSLNFRSYTWNLVWIDNLLMFNGNCPNLFVDWFVPVALYMCDVYNHGNECKHAVSNETKVGQSREGKTVTNHSCCHWFYIARTPWTNCLMFNWELQWTDRFQWHCLSRWTENLYLIICPQDYTCVYLFCLYQRQNRCCKYLLTHPLFLAA